MAEIVRYTEDVIRTDDGAAVDPSRLGDCPRCGRPVIEGKRGYGCSGWRDGCPFVLWREYKGQTLSEDQIRELLQHRVLLEPLTIEGAGAVILQLMDSGDLAEIPVPTGGPRRGGVRSPQGGRTSRRTPGRRAARAPRRWHGIDAREPPRTPPSQGGDEEGRASFRFPPLTKGGPGGVEAPGTKGGPGGVEAPGTMRRPRTPPHPPFVRAGLRRAGLPVVPPLLRGGKGGQGRGACG